MTMTRDSNPPLATTLVLFALVAAGCSGKDRHRDGNGNGNGGSDAFGNSSRSGDGADGGPSAGGSLLDATLPLTGACGRLEVRNVDLLFMVDDSGSMREEQASLRRELPRMIEQLTSGDTNGDGEPDITPIEELHLGVVSSDMGLVGVDGIEKCDGLGDDGVLRHAASPELGDCVGPYPSFLTFRAATDDATQVASDFACVATLGTSGCGFEQQLESTLKALWPSSDDAISFVADPMGAGKLGHGDVENAGFLRPHGGPDTSLLAVVLVTDEDDCSSFDTSHLIPPADLDPSNPDDARLLMQGLNVRCYHNPENLYPVSRYADGLKALRPKSQGLVVFGAITGVPTKLVAPEVLSTVDFADDTAREAFYEGVLSDPEMKPAIETFGTPQPDDDKLKPSCSTANGVAYPPVRIVETARAFGRDAVVQSICQDDFGPAIDALLQAITRASKAACIVE